MDTFLLDCKQSLSKLDKKNTIHFVIGNESCDLDSAISSIVYAFLLNKKDKLNEDYIVLPILNTNRESLKLKTEVLFWVKNVLNLTEDVFICKDDINFENLNQDKKRNIFITLVDHNENPFFESIGLLKEIIDHHKLKLRNNDVLLEIDETVGSCSTLISKRYFDYCEQNNELDEKVILLLYGPILLDTICFSQNAQRFNKLDVNIIEKIEKSFINYKTSRDDTFSLLIEAKNSISSFSFKQLVTKDMKILNPYENFKVLTASFSGLLLSSKFSEENYDEILKELSELCLTYNSSAILMMGIINDDINKIKRDLAIFCLNNSLLNKIGEYLVKNNQNELELKIIKKTDKILLFHQNNVKASRKVVIPILNQLFSADSFVNDFNSGVYQINFEKNDKNLIKGAIKVSKDDSGICEKNSEDKYKTKENKLIEKKNSDNEFKRSDSDHYYESYFEDSFVGDFTGEISNENIDNNDINEINWCDEQKIENALEFGFDSFGPESLIFQNNCESISITNQFKKNGKIDELNEKSFETKNNEKKSFTSENSESNQQENYFDSDLVSLSVSEPQLKEKLNSCFDKNKIKNQYEILAEPKSILFVDKKNNLDENLENECTDPKISKNYHKNDFNQKENCFVENNLDKTENVDSFKHETIENEVSNKKLKLENINDEVNAEENTEVLQRNTNLTKSQRRRITAKYKFEEVPSALDETNFISPDLDKFENLTENSQNKNEINTDQNLQLNKDIKTQDFSKTGTLKKKIVADYQESHEEPTALDIPNYLDDYNKDDKFVENNSEIYLESGQFSSVFNSNSQDQQTDNENIKKYPFAKDFENKNIDMKAIEPYKKVISHGGYYQLNNRSDQNMNSIGESNPAIIIFSACHLPDRSRKDYDYIMDNLFMYVLTTLHELVADDYVLIYFHNAGCGTSNKNNMPTFNWLKRCYYMIDRKLRKNLKALYLVHPTFWLKTLVIMTKPFINSKFSKKLKFVNNLSELQKLVPIESDLIPDAVKQVEDYFEKRQKRKLLIY